ncbi:MAG: hypothetical protein ACLGHG_04585 [Gammaproteobacteria bacterium]
MSESESKPPFTTADVLLVLVAVGSLGWVFFGSWPSSSEPDVNVNDLKITYHPNAEGFISLENCENHVDFLKCTVAPTAKAFGYSRGAPVAVPNYAFTATSFNADGIKVGEKRFPDMDINRGEKVRTTVANLRDGTTSIEIMR